MAQPESYRTYSSEPSSAKPGSAEPRSVEPGPVEPSSVEPGSDLTGVARTLAAHGGGAAFVDLALDLILNEVVEQARLATGATGSAIALARAGEMVCRATTGGNAPDLGVRLDTTSGLSGACLQTGKIQQCNDTELDPRVDAEACRRLGVRAILVLPLGEGEGRGEERFGILEVFSSRPNAFGERDVSTLQVLARRVVVEKKKAEKVSAHIPSVDDRINDRPLAPGNDLKMPLPQKPQETQRPILEPAIVAPDQEQPHQGNRRSEVWTSFLGVLVIAAAVLLGLLLGWRGAIKRGLEGRTQERGGASSGMKANSPPEQGASQGSLPTSAADLAPAASSGAAAQPKTPAAAGAEPPSGGLVVTENGKVIYRLPASGPAAAAGTNAKPDGSGDATRLIHRVEPEYPAEAAAQQIQGLVTLDVQIGDEGAVHNIAVVEGNPVLAAAAVQAVRQWKYQPYVVNGRPVEMQTRITIRFTLPAS